MKKLLMDYIGEHVLLDISGGKITKGILVDLGSDILVLFNGYDYLYIPLMHVHHFRTLQPDEIEIEAPQGEPSLEYDQELSLRKTLTAAKGMFAEIYVTSNQPIHGYITSIMNNYFVFYSPVHKTMLISLNHLKWLIPYSTNKSPYGLTKENLPLNPINMTTARTFEIQIEKHKGELVVFNLGEDPTFVGRLENIQDSLIELVNARQDHIYLNLNHIKSLHFTK